MKLIITNRKLDQAKAAIFSLGIASLVTAVMWIGVSVYFSYTKTTIDSGIDKLITPINPSLNQETVSQYKASRIGIPATFPVMTLVKEGSQARAEAVTVDNIGKQKSPPTSTVSSEIVQ